MLKDFISPRKEYFDPDAHTELRTQRNRERVVTLLAGDLVENTRSDVSGVSARVYRGGRYGFASLAELQRQLVQDRAVCQGWI